METVSPGYLKERQKAEERRDALTASSQEIFRDKRTRVLEIGCGHGHFLSDFAEAHPNQHCIGIDLLSRRVSRAERKKDKREISNIVYLKAEAVEFLETLPEEAQFSQIFILFPDPWPKKRHFRRRFIQQHSLDLLAKHCQDGAQFYFRTDHHAYFEWATEHTQLHPCWKIDPNVPWPFEAPSYFQSLMTEYQSFVAVRRNLA